MGAGATNSDSSSYQHERVPLIHRSNNDNGSLAVVELGTAPKTERRWMILAGGAMLIGFVLLGMTVSIRTTA